MTRVGATVCLDAGEPVLFLSDLHFGDGSRADLFGDQDRRLIDFLESFRERVGSIVFLGDIFDLPQAWAIRRIRSAHAELFGYISRLAREHRVIFVRGNHDWPVPYDEVFPGADRCEAVLLGDRILAWHGHQVDLVMNPEGGGAVFATYAHAALERVAGCRLLPPLERHDTPANRVAVALAVLWARASLVRAKAGRRIGLDARAANIEQRVRYLARSFIGDPADIFGATERTMLGDRYDIVVCGHTHVPGTIRTSRGVFVNTGSWADGIRTYAHWSGERFEVREVDGGKHLGDECFAHLPTETVPEDLLRWWEEHHRGFLRFELDGHWSS